MRGPDSQSRGKESAREGRDARGILRVTPRVTPRGILAHWAHPAYLYAINTQYNTVIKLF